MLSNLFASLKGVFDKSKGEITLCVPAYNARKFIGDTINAISQQSHRDFKCIISVDLSTDRTYEYLESSIDDPRFTIYRQDRRLGWVDNTNFLLQKVKSNYLCLIPHDDILDPDYISILLPTIKADASIAVVYSDIQTFGRIDNMVISQNSISGSKYERVRDFLSYHYDAVHFRGIVNWRRVGRSIYCSGNPLRDFGEDTIWGLKLVLQGNFIRVPQVLYHKRYIGTSYHHSWQEWDLDMKLKAWKLHCNRCLDVISSQVDLNNDEHDMEKILSDRFLQKHKDLWHRGFLGDHLQLIQFPSPSRLT